MVKKNLSDYLAGIGRRGGKASVANLTKAERIACKKESAQKGRHP